MGLERIGLDPEMNKHDFNMRMRKWEFPSFLAYYEFRPNGERKKVQDKIMAIQDNLEAELR